MTVLLNVFTCGLIIFSFVASGFIIFMFIYVFIKSFFNGSVKPACKILERELEECDKTKGDKNEIH